MHRENQQEHDCFRDPESLGADDQDVAGLEAGDFVVTAEGGDAGVISVGDAKQGLAGLDLVVQQAPTVGRL